MDSLVGSPAFEAGITSGMKVIGVNGRVFTQQGLDDAVKATSDASSEISLLVVSDDYIRTSVVKYHGGEKYPHLVRVNEKDDYLDELIKPRAEKQ
jgi:predicted metalloprotease with PDZ domain